MKKIKTGYEPKPKTSPRSQDEHMARRKQDGLSLRAIADEFGTSKSTVHRKLSGQKPDMLRDGYTKIGKINGN